MNRYVSFIAIILAVAVGLIYRLLILCPVSFHPVNLHGKVALVTGASSGIGYETAKKLVEWNATVILPVRNVTKGNIMSDDIISSLGLSHNGNGDCVNVSGHVEVMELDLASFSSVRKFAKIMLERNIHLDILILNAGMQNSEQLLLSKDNVEMVYQVNHLSHFLLTRLLLPLLASPVSEANPSAARIVHVSSSMHYGGSLDRSAYSSTAKNAQKDNMRLGMKSYCDTKLMNVAFSNALDKRLRTEGGDSYRGVTSVSIHPGFVVSDLDRGLSPVLQHVIKTVRSLVGRPTVDGAVTQVTAATKSSMLQYGGGLYFEDQCIMSDCTKCIFCTVNTDMQAGVKPNSIATDVEAQDWLWNTSSEIVGLQNELLVERV